MLPSFYANNSYCRNAYKYIINTSVIFAQSILTEYYKEEYVTLALYIM